MCFVEVIGSGEAQVTVLNPAVEWRLALRVDIRHHFNQPAGGCAVGHHGWHRCSLRPGPLRGACSLPASVRCLLPFLWVAAKTCVWLRVQVTSKCAAGCKSLPSTLLKETVSIHTENSYHNKIPYLVEQQRARQQVRDQPWSPWLAGEVEKRLLCTLPNLRDPMRQEAPKRPGTK